MAAGAVFVEQRRDIAIERGRGGEGAAGQQRQCKHRSHGLFLGIAQPMDLWLDDADGLPAQHGVQHLSHVALGGLRTLFTEVLHAIIHRAEVKQSTLR